ncbi:aha1p [Saccharomyces arboricola H-6]|uniref:Aha1p n=1 Tax=Saccharomyces arboricola (strain H-6 / AS 2.3317 / CBS 10644) TaxID=1160507 RepID=J8PY75_SACAR|nr:aha1p [Saccharomyces arboricola H-6]
MVVNNPNNWHWVDKNCIGWAKEYFREKLVGVHTGSVKDSKYAKIKSVSSIEGDCEVSQRKGKVMSLFDLKLTLLIDGHVDTKDGSSLPFEGSINIPEVAFDSEDSSYQFEISIFKETTELNEVKPLIRSKLLPKLRQLFQQFGKDLLATHGNDIQVPESQVESNYTRSNQQNSFSGVKEASPKPETNASSPATATASTGTKVTQNGSGNSTSIYLEPTFNVPASELYETFLDKQRVLAWSRSAQFFNSGPKLEPKEKFELFGGNVISELVSCEKNKKLLFRWKLKDWSASFNSSIEMTFHESQEFHETKLQVKWTGIPVGEEDRVRGNFEEYYVRSIKLTFGFGAVL